MESKVHPNLYILTKIARSYNPHVRQYPELWDCRSYNKTICLCRRPLRLVPPRAPLTPAGPYPTARPRKHSPIASMASWPRSVLPLQVISLCAVGAPRLPLRGLFPHCSFYRKAVIGAVAVDDTCGPVGRVFESRWPHTPKHVISTTCSPAKLARLRRTHGKQRKSLQTIPGGSRTHAHKSTEACLDISLCAVGTPRLPLRGLFPHCSFTAKR